MLVHIVRVVIVGKEHVELTIIIYVYLIYYKIIKCSFSLTLSSITYLFNTPS